MVHLQEVVEGDVSYSNPLDPVECEWMVLFFHLNDSCVVHVRLFDLIAAPYENDGWTLSQLCVLVVCFFVTNITWYLDSLKWKLEVYWCHF